MTALEFYSKAQRDSLFRAQQLEEARYQKKLAVAVAVAVGTGWIAYVFYCGFMQKRWPGDLGVGLALVLCAFLYSHARARLGALEAMESKEPNQAPEPTAPSARGSS